MEGVEAWPLASEECAVGEVGWGGVAGDAAAGVREGLAGEENRVVGGAPDCAGKGGDWSGAGSGV